MVATRGPRGSTHVLRVSKIEHVHGNRSRRREVNGPFLRCRRQCFLLNI